MQLSFSLAPTDKPAGSVLLAHGYGEHPGRYEHLLTALNEAGYDTWTFNFAGHGTTPGPSGKVDANIDVGVLIRQHLEARKEALEHSRSERMFLFGHSMGGLITLASSILDPTHLQAVAVTGPALKPLPTIPLPVAKAAAAAARLLPNTPTVALDDSLLSTDPQVIMDYRQDPLVFQGKVPLLTGMTMTVQGHQTLENAALVSKPTLIVHGDQDGLASLSGSVEFAEKAGELVTLIEVPGGYHEVLNEPDGAKQIETIINWYKQW